MHQLRMSNRKQIKATLPLLLPPCTLLQAQHVCNSDNCHVTNPLLAAQAIEDTINAAAAAATTNAAASATC
jgi:hypothetical protein